MAITRRSIWTKLWLGWLLAFLLIEVAAVLFTPGAEGTFSVNIWGRWFTGWTILLAVGFLALLIAHFVDRGRHWWSSGLAIIAGAIPVVLTILGREKMLGKIWGAVKGTYNWVLRRGPVISSALTGIALVIPQAAPVLKIIAGFLGGGVGLDQHTSEVSGEVAGGLLMFIGSLRKAWSMYQNAKLDKIALGLDK